MPLYGAASSVEAPPVQVGTVWVGARHLLVAQTLAAALVRRIPDVQAVVCEPNAVRGAGMDPTRDLLLVVDDLDSPTAVASVRALLPSAPARTVLITGLPRCHTWGALLAAGAAEIIPEPDSIDELAQVIQRVCAGAPVIGEAERTELCAAWERHVAEDEVLQGRMAMLSPRELLVLQSLASGRVADEIGEILGVARSTVRSHIRSIRAKLEVDTQIRAVLVMHRLESRIMPIALDVPAPRPPQD